MEVSIKEIAKNRAYLFCASTPVPVTEEMLKWFISNVTDYVQQHFPNRSYNYYEETHRDMLSVVAVLDANEIKEMTSVDF